MSSRDYLKHTVSITQPPTHGNLGDEWYNPTSNKLYKLVANSGVTVNWSEVGAGASQSAGTADAASTNAIIDARVQNLTVNVSTSANVISNTFVMRGTGNASLVSSTDFTLQATGNLNLSAANVVTANLVLTGAGAGAVTATGDFSIGALGNINLNAGNLVTTANTFILNGSGVPTLFSDSVLSLNANTAVVIGNTTLRFAALNSTANVASPQIGDTFYSNLNNSLMTYAWTNATVKAWTEVGYRSLPVTNTQAAAYSITTTDTGKILLHNGDTTARTWTVPGNMIVGTRFTFINANSAGVLTITPTGDHIMLAGSSTINPAASRTLAANAVAILYKITSNTWYISGSGIT
jgi:hypothetical protein